MFGNGLRIGTLQVIIKVPCRLIQKALHQDGIEWHVVVRGLVMISLFVLPTAT